MEFLKIETVKAGKCDQLLIIWDPKYYRQKHEID